MNVRAVAAWALYDFANSAGAAIYVAHLINSDLRDPSVILGIYSQPVWSS